MRPKLVQIVVLQVGVTILFADCGFTFAATGVQSASVGAMCARCLLLQTMNRL